MKTIIIVVILAAITLSLCSARRLSKSESKIQRHAIKHENAVYLELLDQIQAEGDSLSATPLTPLDRNLDECNPSALKQQQCQNSVAQYTQNTLTGNDIDASIESAVSGIDEWLQSFKKKVGPGESAWLAARSAVKPLITRLKRTQHAAVERLIRSNHDILAHVEEVATEHIFNLVKASQTKQKEADRMMRAAEKRRDLFEDMEAQKMAIQNNPVIIKLEASNSTAPANNAALQSALNQEKKLEQEVKKALGV